MTGSFRWAYGTLAAAALTSAYAISDFPRQDDQPVGLDWRMDIDPSDLYLDSAELVDALDFSRGGFGEATFTLLSAVMSGGMMQYVRTNLFQGGYSAPATVMTRDRASYGARWKTVTATALWPDLSQAAELGGGGYMKVKFVFVNARIAGRAWSSAFSSAWG